MTVLTIDKYPMAHHSEWVTGACCGFLELCCNFIIVVLYVISCCTYFRPCWLIMTYCQSGSTLAQVSDVTKPLAEPTLTFHSEVLWHTPESNFTMSNEVTKFCIMSVKIILLILQPHLPGAIELTHWGRVTHICVNKLTIFGSDDGLSPGRRQAIIWTNAAILLIWTFRTNLSEIFKEMHTFSLKKIHLKMSSGKWRPFCPGLNVSRWL